MEKRVMKNVLMVWIAVTSLLTGCSGGSDESETTPSEASAVSTEEAVVDTIPMTNLASLTIGDYEVQPMYEEELKDGHFNIRITGGEVAAVREWVGPEDASGVVVVKTEIENDYHHGHIDMPDPIPADARLWIEIEAPDGTLHKGSVPLGS
jgi:catechol 2,3-dioxygenase-like lactoylglutathione lyase family enzyme